jgi:cell division protease FtsH
MVSIYGLNERIGNISFYDRQGSNTFTKPYSDETARIIDEEVSILIESQYQRALKILTENKEKLSMLADKLLTSEVIFKEDLVEIFGKRQWESEEETPLLAETENEASTEETTSEEIVNETTETTDTTNEATEDKTDGIDESTDESPSENSTKSEDN